MKPNALQDLDDEIAYWTAQHLRGNNEVHYAAFGIATGLKLAKSILLEKDYECSRSAR
jgi:hypothetical protein